MAESTTQNTSIGLYNYLCRDIVGTEEDVKTIRMMNTARDNLQSDMNYLCITSGSFGEGLKMRGSDLDIMMVITDIEIFEDQQMYSDDDDDYDDDTDIHSDDDNSHIYTDDDDIYIHFIMDMKDTQPCFTKMRLMHCNTLGVGEICEIIDDGFFLSSFLIKQLPPNEYFTTVHGPCVSDEEGLVDMAYCVHNKSWITPAKQWLTRSNNSWPRYEVKQAIIKHGVLFVPVGVKGSVTEDLEWRISFSVAEKLLIYTFTHTQLLFYALMKILLKDVIDLDIDCKELLCSYFIKTILLWISEELPTSIWKIENLIPCYMRCFRRLIYCVEYKVCPHYFIPENNLFKNRIKGHAQEILLTKLHILNSYGWQCILLSDQISNIHSLAFDVSKQSMYLLVSCVLSSITFLVEMFVVVSDTVLEKVIYKILYSKSSKIKYLYTYCMSKYCFNSDRLLPLEDIADNKSIYKQQTTYISNLLLHKRHDAVSRWLLLASFFYRGQQYNTALFIVEYSLLKFSPEKLQQFMKLSDLHYEMLNSHVFREMSIFQLLRFLLLDFMRLRANWRFLLQDENDELQINLHSLLPAVVYAHFLRFLCHYRLRNSRQCLDSLRDLQLNIEENVFLADPKTKSLSYKILGKCFQLLGNIESAREAFMQSNHIRMKI